MCLLAVLKSIIVKQLQHIAIIRAFVHLGDLLGFTVPGGAEKLLGCGLLGGEQWPHFFPSSQIDSKLRFLNVVLQLYFTFFP